MAFLVGEEPNPAISGCLPLESGFLWLQRGSANSWFLLQNFEDYISQFLQRHRGGQKFCTLRPTSSNHHLLIMQIPNISLQQRVKEFQEEALAIACHWFMSALSSLGPLMGHLKRKVMLPGDGDACNASLHNDSVRKCFQRTCAATPRGGLGRQGA